MTTPISFDPTFGAARNLEELRARVAGSVLIPGDDLYQEARLVLAFQYDRFPSMIVRAAGPNDVVEAVRFARAHRLPLAVRGGSHSVAGFSTVDGALLVDLTEMRGVVIDPERQVGRVQGGVRSVDLAGPAHEYGLALTTGDTGTVGLGGLVTGGGVGWFVRKYGLAADRLISAKIVTARGELIEASATQNSDLFWAIRGGGGNFGIVVEFEFQLLPVKYIVGGALVLPATKEVVRGYLEYTANAPDELSTTANLMAAPPAPFIPEDRIGEQVLVILGAWCGDPAKADAAYAPLRALAEPVVDTIDTIPYPAMFQYMAFAEARHGAAIRMMFTDEVPDETIDDLLEASRNAAGPLNHIHLRGLGGELSRIPAESTAFAHRQRKYFVSIIAVWLDPDDDGTAHEAWADALWSRINHLRNGAYVNFLQSEGEARLRDAYPAEVYRRLAEVKAKYDPENIFRFNQNIRPAPAAAGQTLAA